MSNDANMLEHIQWKFTGVCFNCCSPCVHDSYTNALESLKLHTQCETGHHLDARLFVNVLLTFVSVLRYLCLLWML
jgi:hypothetical protein